MPVMSPCGSVDAYVRYLFLNKYYKTKSSSLSSVPLSNISLYRCSIFPRPVHQRTQRMCTFACRRNCLMAASDDFKESSQHPNEQKSWSPSYPPTKCPPCCDHDATRKTRRLLESGGRKS
nr:hypothetical protein BgiMline_009800 [Biomphalaria glabrata]